jgi:hypothetical protein
VNSRKDNDLAIDRGGAEAKTPVELCILLWPRKGRAAELVAYEDKVLQLIPDHGGTVMQRLQIPVPK